MQVYTFKTKLAPTVLQLVYLTLAHKLSEQKLVKVKETQREGGILDSICNSAWREYECVYSRTLISSSATFMGQPNALGQASFL